LVEEQRRQHELQRQYEATKRVTSLRIGRDLPVGDIKDENCKTFFRFTYDQVQKKKHW
jgi:hypothetical protein